MEYIIQPKTLDAIFKSEAEKQIFVNAVNKALNVIALIPEEAALLQQIMGKVVESMD